MKTYFLFFYFLISSSFWGLKFIDSTIIGQINTVIFFILFFYSLYKRSKIQINNNYFSKYLDFFCFFPLLSFIGAFIFFSQSPLDTIRVWVKTCPIWMLPYSLIAFRYTKEEIYKAILLYVIGFGVISLLTNFNDGFALMFADINDDGTFEMRNGQIRMRIPGDSFIVFSYIYTLFRLINKKSTKFEYIAFIMSIISLYNMQTRQILLAVAIMTIYICLKDKRTRRYGFLVLILGCIYLIYNFNNIFGDFAEQTQNELDDKDYNRWKSFEFYYDKITDNILVFFLGYGQSANNTEYYKFVNNLWTKYGIAAQDVGFVGTCYYYGIIYVLYYFRVVYIIGWKMRNKISSEISMFILCTFLYCIFIFPFTEDSFRAILWSLIFYIIIIEKNRIKLKQT